MRGVQPPVPCHRPAASALGVTPRGSRSGPPKEAAVGVCEPDFVPVCAVSGPSTAFPSFFQNARGGPLLGSGNP